MPAAVSIITVYYNTPDDLRNLWNSMRKNLAPDTYEFIVADNNSDQNIQQEFPGITYLRLPQNYGFARANNIAAQQANGKFLFFLNPDCIFIDDCVTALLMNRGDAAIAAPRVLNPNRSIQVSFGPALSLFGEVKQKRRVRRESLPTTQLWLQKLTSRAFSPDFVGGAALLIQADAFRLLKGFDENFFLYEEDVDLCERARKLGLKILYIPSAQIVHLRGTSASRNSERVNLEYRKSQIYFYQKHRGFLQTLLLRLYLTLKFLFQPAMLKWIWNHDHISRQADLHGTEKMRSD